jgi:hypothetical protein
MSDKSDLLDAKAVVERRERAGHGLPEAVLRAAAAHEASRALPVPDPEDVVGPRHPGDAAAAIADRLVAGEPVDVLASAEEVEENVRRHAMRGKAWGIAADVRGITGERLARALALHAEEIVTEFLRPSYDTLLVEARALSELLRAAAIDPLAPPPPVWADPPPAEVRDALRGLSELAGRRALIADARDRVVRVAGLLVEKDPGLFAYVERPQAFAPPGWRPPRPLARPEPPAEPLGRLLWLVRDAWDADAGPWLSLPSEQDAAWTAVLGRRAREDAARADEVQAAVGR